MLLQIPQPCQNDWEKMDATQRGRYCHDCKLQVIDFSPMTPLEIKQYLMASKQHTCCRITADKLQEVNLALAAKPNPRFKLRHTVMPLIAGSMLMASTAYGQALPEMPPQANTVEQKSLKPTKADENTFHITGTVKSKKTGKAIDDAWVTISITDEEGGYESVARFNTKADGKFDFVLDKKQFPTGQFRVHVYGDAFLASQNLYCSVDDKKLAKLHVKLKKAKHVYVLGAVSF